MVPRTAAKGHSFKGAGMYYLHDRGAQTDDRVVFSETRNLPTSDAKKGLKWMSYTAMHAEEIKHAAGGDRRGGKAKSGAVYSFSLAWHPEQEPDRTEMTKAADSFMAKLGLNEHQAVLVAHNDANHDHIHGIVNLVHPETGKRAKLSLDHIKMSKWAQQYEEEQGKIYCQKRAENNAKRDRLKQEKLKKSELQKEFSKAADEKRKEQSAFVKHREKEAVKASTIFDLYNRSDSGKAFKSALQEQGYTLAKGDRRGYVLVDQNGKVSSLSRQLKGQRAAAIKKRLQDIEEIQNAKDIQAQRAALQEQQIKQNNERPQARKEADMNQQPEQKTPPVHDRDAEEVERQKALSDAAMEAAMQSSRKQTPKETTDGKGGDDRPLEKANDNQKDEGSRSILRVIVSQDELDWWEEKTETYRRQEQTDVSENFDSSIRASRKAIAELEKKSQSRLQLKGTRKRREQELAQLRQQLSNDIRLRKENMQLIEQRIQMRFPHPEEQARKRAEQAELQRQLKTDHTRKYDEYSSRNKVGGPKPRPRPPQIDRDMG